MIPRKYFSTFIIIHKNKKKKSFRYNLITTSPYCYYCVMTKAMNLYHDVSLTLPRVCFKIYLRPTVVRIMRALQYG